MDRLDNNAKAWTIFQERYGWGLYRRPDSDLCALFRQTLLAWSGAQSERNRRRETDRMQAKLLSCKRLKRFSKHLQSATQYTVRKCIKALQSLCRNIALCKRLANHPPQSLPPADHIAARIRPMNVTRVLTSFKRNPESLSLSRSLLPLSLSNRISFDACPTQSCACMRGHPCAQVSFDPISLCILSDRHYIYLLWRPTRINALPVHNPGCIVHDISTRLIFGRRGIANK